MDWEHDGGACLFWINWVIVWVCSPPISPLRVGLGVSFLFVTMWVHPGKKEVAAQILWGSELWLG